MKPYTEIVPAIAVFSLLMFTVACTDANSPTPSSDRSQPDIATTAQESGSGDVAAGEGSSSGTIVIKTNKGEIIVELNREKAPITVANFLQYVDKGSYDGTIFHRVIPGFMIQGGGFDTDYKKRPTDPPIKNEAGNGLANDTGTIAMARTSVVDSATAQFFINVVNNRFLNHKSDRANEYGYTVFGKVVAGTETVKSIETTPTENRGGPFSDAPVEQVVIESIRRK